ncbi:MAG: hypothetical protein U0Y68_16560 [Blastocatellia bacterium]
MPKAQAFLQEALTLSRTTKNRLLEADILHELARFAFTLKDSSPPRKRNSQRRCRSQNNRAEAW